MWSGESHEGIICRSSTKRCNLEKVTRGQTSSRGVSEVFPSSFSDSISDSQPTGAELKLALVAALSDFWICARRGPKFSTLFKGLKKLLKKCYLVVLIGCDRNEGRLREYVSAEGRVFGTKAVILIRLHDVNPRLIFVHRVQDDLQKTEGAVRSAWDQAYRMQGHLEDCNPGKRQENTKTERAVDI